MAPDGKGIDRRSFLRLAAASPALALGGCTPAEQASPPTADGEMRYRPLGNTGLKVSEVSFGAHGHPETDLSTPPAHRVGQHAVYTQSRQEKGQDTESRQDGVDHPNPDVKLVQEFLKRGNLGQRHVRIHGLESGPERLGHEPGFTVHTDQQCV